MGSFTSSQCPDPATWLGGMCLYPLRTEPAKLESEILLMRGNLQSCILLMDQRTKTEASLVEEPLQNLKLKKFVSLKVSFAMLVFCSSNGKLNKENLTTALMFKFWTLRFPSATVHASMVVFAKMEAASAKEDSKARIANLTLTTLPPSFNKQLVAMLVSLLAVEFLLSSLWHYSEVLTWYWKRNKSKENKHLKLEW